MCSKHNLKAKEDVLEHFQSSDAEFFSFIPNQNMNEIYILVWIWVLVIQICENLMEKLEYLEVTVQITIMHFLLLYIKIIIIYNLFYLLLSHIIIK